ncbi:MAG: type II toxin-antitoxin system VapC family toxin [Rhizobiaceae bacterium]|nr:type II toxin-antitoxin system VapC family toxin [Rhizobiaceae bacterium]MCV0407731.1 type II toxin-antitoxin system VapC family toxin [Rhizobiaceae bacterium]
MIDSSVALAWFLPDEGSTLADQALDQVTTAGALVPALFSVEFGNGLVMAVRRKRIDSHYRRETFQRITELNLVADRDGGDRVWAEAIDLADLHGLTLYDAVYLELALRTGLPLASLDKRLSKVASDLGISLNGQAAGRP